MTAPRHYSTAQIALHWIIAVLVVFQIVGHEGMESAWRALSSGGAPAAGDLKWAYAHVVSGVTILILAVIRTAIRLTRGAPELPENHPVAVKYLAHATHVLLYAFILVMPLTGAMAWFGGVEASAALHAFGRFVLVPLILLHIAGALAEPILFKSKSLQKIIGVETDR